MQSAQYNVTPDSRSYHVTEGLYGRNVESYRTRSAAEYGARLLNSGLAHISPHNIIGCRIEFEPAPTLATDPPGCKHSPACEDMAACTAHDDPNARVVRNQMEGPDESPAAIAPDHLANGCPLTA